MPASALCSVNPFSLLALSVQSRLIRALEGTDPLRLLGGFGGAGVGVAVGVGVGVAVDVGVGVAVGVAVAVAVGVGGGVAVGVGLGFAPGATTK